MTNDKSGLVSTQGRRTDRGAETVGFFSAGASETIAAQGLSVLSPLMQGLGGIPAKGAIIFLEAGAAKGENRPKAGGTIDNIESAIKLRGCAVAISGRPGCSFWPRNGVVGRLYWPKVITTPLPSEYDLLR